MAIVQIHIARLKGSLQSTQTLLRVKGNPLFDEKAALKAWLGVRKPDASDYVFNSQKSIQLSRVTVFKLYRQIARKAGLGETLQHPHVLKHTAAMLLVQQGANAFLIRQAMGHKSFDSTLAYVQRVSPLFFARDLSISLVFRLVMLHFGKLDQWKEGASAKKV